jgi:HlyD family secretion protein
MKRTMIITLAVVGVVAVAALGTQALRGARTSGSTGYETAAARRGEIVAMINATGSIAARSRASLTFSSPGQITEINVSVGDKVQGGQVLAAIDARELQQAVAQAEALQRMSSAQLAAAQKGASAEDVAAARANLTSTQEQLNRLQAGTSATDLEIARLRWEQAKDQLWSAQAQRDATVGNSSAPGYTKDQANAAVASAEMAAEIARLQYEQAKAGAKTEDVRAAEAQVAQAQANLARLTTGPAAEDIASAQAQVDQNAAALQQARLRQEGAVLTAPFAGVVAAVNGRVGEITSMSQPVVTIVDLGLFHIDVDIDEASIGALQVGQKARISLDAFPDKTLTGAVTHIDPVGTLSQGLVNYRVTVQLDPADLPVKADMTASVDIVTASKSNAVLVPARAVRRDRTGSYVETLVNSQPKRIDVETGLTNDSDIEITKGLKEGTRVVTSSPRQSPFTLGASLGGK